MDPKELSAKWKAKTANLFLAERLAANLIDRSQDMNKAEVIIIVNNLLMSRYEVLPDMGKLIDQLRNSDTAFNNMVLCLADELDATEGY